jgi:hypothetical protein
MTNEGEEFNHSLISHFLVLNIQISMHDIRRPLISQERSACVLTLRALAKIRTKMPSTDYADNTDFFEQRDNVQF